MKRTDLIAAVVAAGLAKDTATTAVDEVLKAMQESLKNGDEVRLDGIGVLSVKEVGERSGRNLRTGEAITIAAHKEVKFKAFDTLKKVVNG